MKEKRVPLLHLLQRRFPLREREKLLALILCGEIYIDGTRVRDPALQVSAGVDIDIRGNRRYVSRGGEKLQAVLEAWNVDPTGKIVLDAGASTGGFTDCLLQNGAKRVYAVDVGYNQLAFRLRRDPRVEVLERTNIMELSGDSLDPRPQVAVADLAFRSIIGAAAHLLDVVTEGRLIALVKPQFEWIRPDDGFDGVVEKADAVFRIAARVVEQLWKEGSYTNRVAPSPIRGAKGNAEIFFLLETAETATIGAILADLRRLLTEGILG